MIPPVTGNGMSMALEAAERAVPALTAYSHGTVGWAKAVAAIEQACDRTFRPRLRWSAWFHPLLFQPLGRAAFLQATKSLELWRGLIQLVR
jgi:2-polyprenyl-6-methoxyphenol hydroxylase-like FAD-dependent oxidoreductase